MDQTTQKRPLEDESGSGWDKAKKRRTKEPGPDRVPRENEWRIEKKDIIHQGTKDALQVHIRALWKLTEQTAIPPLVSNSERETYAKRFTTEIDVRKSVMNGLDKHADRFGQASKEAQDLKLSLTGHGQISRLITAIPDRSLTFMFQNVAGMGLERWNPDVRSMDPESMYNLLHEQIAISTFKQACAHYGYTTCITKDKLVNDDIWTQKMYRNFVFGYMAKKAKEEDEQPGTAVRKARFSNCYKRRIKVKTMRTTALVDSGFQRHTINLSDAHPDAHSDDELVTHNSNSASTTSSQPTAPYYRIKTNEGRHPKVNAFFRIIDDRALAAARRERAAHTRAPLRRVEPSVPVATEFTALPKSGPVDYFSPDFWNDDMTLVQRIKYTSKGVYVALPKQEHCITWNEIRKWKALGATAFMTQYGLEVLNEYDMPTDEQRDDYEEGKLGGGITTSEEEEEEEEEEQMDQT